MPLFNYTLSGSIEVPEGSTLTKTETGIILPDGRVLKIWESFELHATEDSDDIEMVSVDTIMGMGIYFDGAMCGFEEALS